MRQKAQQKQPGYPPAGLSVLSAHLAGDAALDAGTSRHGPDTRTMINSATFQHDGRTHSLEHFHLRRPRQPARAHEMILCPNPMGMAPSLPSKTLISSPSTRNDTDSKVGGDMVTSRIDTSTLPCVRVLLANNPWLVMHSLGKPPQA